MTLITHMNHVNLKNEVYCCLRNKVVELDPTQKGQFCNGCKMYAGDAGGKGVACVWEDMRDVNNPHTVLNPIAEFASNQLRQVRLDGPSFLFFGI
ncbi:hypothetical protein D3C73_578340 [compost metagenome]